jgi:hypothetical protein
MEASNADIFKKKIEWIKCAIRGALSLSEEALIESTFKQEMSEKLNLVYSKIESFASISEEAKINEFFPMLEDEQKTVEDIREVFYKVIKTHKPQKFQARLMESRDYSHNLKVQFCVVDFVSNKLAAGLASFFQEEILKKLNNQFELLCDEMLKAIQNENIDINGATQRIKEIAPNALEEDINTVLNDISKAQDKKKHVVFKTLTDKKATLEKKKDEPKVTLKKFETKDFTKELTKSVDKAKKYETYLSKIQNPAAKDFFLTYYSGQDKKGYDPQPMFTYFITYIAKNFGFNIQENNENYKEFCQKADADGSLQVDLEELTSFFEKHLNFDAKTITGLDMAKDYHGGSGAT